MATTKGSEIDLQRLVLTVADANSAIDQAVQANVLTPAAAQQLLVLLEDAMHDVFPLAFPDRDFGFGGWVGDDPACERPSQ